MMIELAEAYCESLNTGRIPTIESAWDYVCSNESQKGVNEATRLIENEFRGLAKRLPVNSEILERQKE